MWFNGYNPPSIRSIRSHWELWHFRPCRSIFWFFSLFSVKWFAEDVAFWFLFRSFVIVLWWKTCVRVFISRRQFFKLYLAFIKPLFTWCLRIKVLKIDLNFLNLCFNRLFDEQLSKVNLFFITWIHSNLVCKFFEHVAKRHVRCTRFIPKISFYYLATKRTEFGKTNLLLFLLYSWKRWHGSEWWGVLVEWFICSLFCWEHWFLACLCLWRIDFSNCVPLLFICSFLINCTLSQRKDHVWILLLHFTRIDVFLFDSFWHFT